MILDLPEVIPTPPVMNIHPEHHDYRPRPSRFSTSTITTLGADSHRHHLVLHGLRSLRHGPRSFCHGPRPGRTPSSMLTVMVSNVDLTDIRHAHGQRSRLQGRCKRGCVREGVGRQGGGAAGHLPPTASCAADARPWGWHCPLGVRHSRLRRALSEPWGEVPCRKAAAEPIPVRCPAVARDPSPAMRAYGQPLSVRPAPRTPGPPPCPRSRPQTSAAAPPAHSRAPSPRPAGSAACLRPATPPSPAWPRRSAAHSRG